ncbi:MAG: efflux RND transporter permease subunit, partial [bacterium]
DPDNFPVVILGARSPRGMEELTRILEREISQRFEQIPGAGSVDVWGGVYRQIQVRLKRDRLASSQLSATDVQQALLRENVTLPGGDMREGLSDMYVRTRGEYESIDQIASTIITVVDGKPIRIGDVAEVVDGYEDINRLVQVDGLPMVRLGLRKQSGANTVAVAQKARQVMEQINEERDDLELMMVIDQSEFIKSSISNVQKSALWGGLLAVLVLYLFLRNGSTTFIIALSIPISIIATFGLLFFNHLTLNQMSFGGLALGIGLIVDNAIVVLENMVRLREGGRDLKESALVGTKQVAGAIIASTATTMVIFLPVLFMQTISGMLFRELALVVVFALLCSLLVALTLVPMLGSRFLTVKPGGNAGGRLASRLGGWFTALETGYSRLLRTVLHHRIMVIAVTCVLLAVSVFLWTLLPVDVAGRIPGADIRVQAQSGLWMLRRLFGSGTGEAVQLELLGYDLDLADQVARQIKKTMESVPEIEDVRISRREGRPEQNLVIDREKIAKLGLSVSQIAQVIQTNVGGSQAGVFREGGDEFPIVVRLQPDDRLSTLDLGNVAVRTSRGRILPVSAVVRTERRRSPLTIDRVDGQRVTYITANLRSGAALGDVIGELRGKLRDVVLPRDFSIMFGGEYLEQQKARKDFIVSIVMAVILIYMVMAAQFERFVDPLIVMVSVPLAIIGVVPTLLITGTSLNVQSLMGVIMLIGIVVNNAIVLVDYINLMRREQKLGIAEAVLQSGRRRLRPILMTACTTVLGMLPLAFGTGAGGEIQAALARTVIGGLTVSTLITLVLIPAVYTGVYDLLGKLSVRGVSEESRDGSAAPA